MLRESIQSVHGRSSLCTFILHEVFYFSLSLASKNVNTADHHKKNEHDNNRERKEINEISSLRSGTCAFERRAKQRDGFHNKNQQKRTTGESSVNQ
mmetsp:Transcript_24521/g.61500  ORF Transcript_24521/g.61500 Transcript_24521/m.61500 type:complete len:96 (+) Transcript_24521:467-754(+)